MAAVSARQWAAEAAAASPEAAPPPAPQPVPEAPPVPPEPSEPPAPEPRAPPANATPEEPQPLAPTLAEEQAAGAAVPRLEDAVWAMHRASPEHRGMGIKKFAAAFKVGLGRIVALYDRSSASYQIHQHNRCLDF